MELSRRLDVFQLLFVKWLHFVEGLSLVIWFIFSLGEFVSLCLSNDLYFHLGNLCLSFDLYHFARCMIYTPVWGICIILLVVWFIIPLRNLYHFSRHMIYTPAWRICIILLVIWFILPLGEFVSFCSSTDLYSRLGNLYNFAHHMIYSPAWGICIIYCWKDSLTQCHFGPSWGHVIIYIK